MNENIISKAITNLRFPMALLVVLLHCFESYNNFEYGLTVFSTNAGLFEFIGAFFSYSICQLAVPVFFIITGYLYFCNVTNYGLHEYLAKNKKRIKTLVIPYIIWCSLFFIYCVGPSLFHGNGIENFLQYLESKNGSYGIFWSAYEITERSTFLGFEKNNFLPLLVPMWYLRDCIVIMFLFTPVIWYILSKKIVGPLLLIFLFVLYVIGIPSPIPGVNITSLFFFSVGSYFAINKDMLYISLRQRVGGG